MSLHVNFQQIDSVDRRLLADAIKRVDVDVVGQCCIGCGEVGGFGVQRPQRGAATA
jgi:hypothetical protein